VASPGTVLHEQRLVKRPDELALLRKAADLTAEGHFSAMRDGQAGRREHQVQAEIEYAFRRRGAAGPGYGTIVAAGANSTILHYRAGDAELRDGEVCLVDAGGEYGLYTADVTRTFPVSGSFSGAQRDLYQACLDAQKRAIEAVKPGATIDGIHALTVRASDRGAGGPRPAARAGGGSDRRGGPAGESCRPARPRSGRRPRATGSTTCIGPATGWGWTCTTWATTW